ncbi:MAG: hypothetical protein R3F53_20110 [Gammaproteobacteria bacterium]
MVLKNSLTIVKMAGLIPTRLILRRFAHRVHGVLQLLSRFSALVELLGLSIDSISHLAWVRNIKRNSASISLFPGRGYLSMQVANAYGMIQPGASDTSAVQATF